LSRQYISTIIGGTGREPSLETNTMQGYIDEGLRTELATRRERLERAVLHAPQAREFRALLSEVDAALARMNAGTFGLCETCGDPIERDRLVADPLIRRCIDHLTADERRGLDQDLELAARIQLTLLPPREIAACGWDIAYHFEPFGHVGGDYCDVVLPDPRGDRLFFLLGDVSGKGVAASLLMSNLHATFRSLINVGLNVEDLLARANRLFCQSTMDAHYATLVCGRATASGHVDLANAGHWPIAVVRRGATDFASSSGLALGMFCSAEYVPERLQLEPGDFMVLYTDGLTEARNYADEEYGAARLAARLDDLARRARLTAREITSACLDDLRAFCGAAPKADDLTVMVIRRAG
jgi:sigma-B regulation protein RsbU (phosphoserine phosphatase)